MLKRFVEHNSKHMLGIGLAWPITSFSNEYKTGTEHSCGAILMQVNNLLYTYRYDEGMFLILSFFSIICHGEK